MFKKRIAILSVHASPLAQAGGKKAGGMNVYIRELAPQFARSGIAVDIYTRRSDHNAPEVDYSLGDGIRVIHLPAGLAHLLTPDDIYPHLSQFAAGVIAFTTRHNITYDLIYSHYWLSGWVAQKLKEVWNIPFVQMFHTLGHMKNRISPGQPPCPDVRVAVETRIVEWADCIVAATPAEHAQLLWLYRADRRKIAIVPPGVDAERFSPLGHVEAKRQLGLDEDQNLLLFVGRIEPLKAVDSILEAIGLIRQQCSSLLDGVYFAVIGGDPKDPDDLELARLQSMAANMCLKEQVRFLGTKDHDMLPSYYAAASAVIVPSDYESFGMVALEAMASGTPVIASDVGGLAFLVRDSQTGFLVPVRDPSSLAKAIRVILTEPEQRQKLGQNAAELAQQYAWPHIAEQLISVFDGLLTANVTAVSLRRR